MELVGDENNAACNLVGEILNGRWKVLEGIDRSAGGTGGKFSVRYIVEDVDTKQKGFLKALNYKAFFAMNRGADIVTVLKEQNAAFEYERDVLLRCRGSRLSKVTRLFDNGTAELEKYAIPTVPYLIFEIAEGDVRSKIDFSNKLDLAWKLKSLHNVAVGLSQLHSIGISHQDLKPSNVLVYENGMSSKISDLGNSLCKEITAPHEDANGRFAGDADYIPIEFLYRHVEHDVDSRRMSTDMYLFGNLIAFYFSGLNMTSLITRNTPKQFSWRNWAGSYTTVRDYLMPGFYRALKEFRKGIEHVEIGEEMTKMLEYTCFPYPNDRGHPRSKKLAGNQYEYSRIISRLDILYKKVELEIILRGN